MTDLNDVIAMLKQEIQMREGPYWGYDDALYYRTIGEMDAFTRALEWIEEVTND